MANGDAGAGSANDVVARRPRPKNADELLFACQLAVADGDVDGAAEMARMFLKDMKKGKRLDFAETYRRQAYAWYILTIAAYRVSLTRPEAEAHETLVFFFKSHKKASWYFLKYLQAFDHGFRISMKDTGIRDDVDRMHAAVYRAWGTGKAGRADLEANRQVDL